MTPRMVNAELEPEPLKMANTSAYTIIEAIFGRFGCLTIKANWLILVWRKMKHEEAGFGYAHRPYYRAGRSR